MSGNRSREEQRHSSGEQTLSYYSQNAEAFFRETISLGMADHRGRFLAHISLGGRILDAGCGSGRDSKIFIESGSEVIAFDGSTEMAKIASEFLGREVLNILFKDMNFYEEFDGIWACASLLHIPKAQLPDTLKRFSAAIEPGGVLYLN